MCQANNIPPTPQNPDKLFHELVNLARFLRSDAGCPWDQKQTARSFAGYLVDEAQEFIEALDSGDNHHAEEEFGDCLFTLLASLAAAEHENRFNLENALKRAHAKMVRRHQHVFGPERVTTAEEALAAWEEIKTLEKAEKKQREQC